MAKPYRLNFRFEWMADTVFQTANDAARDQFGIGMIAPENFPLTPTTIDHIHKLSRWHDASLNPDYPPDPSLWRQAECDRFNAAARDLFETVVRELGTDFEVIYLQADLVEDPDLDAYLQDPKSFRRKLD